MDPDIDFGYFGEPGRVVDWLLANHLTGVEESARFVFGRWGLIASYSGKLIRRTYKRARKGNELGKNADF